MRTFLPLAVLLPLFAACAADKGPSPDDSAAQEDSADDSGGGDDSATDDSAADDSGEPAGCESAAALLGGRAYDTVQDALDAATDGALIEVCPGTWRENLVVPAAFTGSLELRGGGPEAADIDGSAGGAVLDVQSGASVRVTGLTLHSGAGLNVEGERRGGGIYCVGSAIVLDDAVVRDNTAVLGGGVYMLGCTLDGVGGAVRANFSDDGAGIYVDRDDDRPARLADLTIEDNEAVYNGGGVYFKGRGRGAVDLVIERCELVGNRGYDGGGVYEDSNNATLEITDSSFTGNEGKEGGGVYLSSGATIEDVSFYGNFSEKQGGHVWVNDGSEALFRRASFGAGVAEHGAAIWGEGTFSFEAIRCDFSGPPDDNMPEDIATEAFTANYGDNVTLSCTQTACTEG